MIRTIKRIGICLILLAFLAFGGWVFWMNKDNEVAVEPQQQVELSPTQVRSIEAIGQWEFLAVSDEELVDTIRKGFFYDDQLTRIYYGTLRLGVDMSRVQEGWVTMRGDTIVCTLPPVQLLDKNFIDEARTRSFYESGKWSNADREALYLKACDMMRRRCLTAQNMNTARDNGRTQFRHLLQTMGFDKVVVKYEDN